MDDDADRPGAPCHGALAGFLAHACDAHFTDEDWVQLADEEPPASVRAFADLWVDGTLDLWSVVVESAARQTPSIRSEISDQSVLAPFRALLSRAQPLAVIYGHPHHWTSPNQWAYLLKVNHGQHSRDYGHMLMHPPAREEDITQAERILGIPLPPSYRHFLLLTNGLGVGEAENGYVCGAGPQRAIWAPVMLNAWMKCGAQHEIAARWREFQGVYADERVMDRERSENTFRSDETALIPFATTYEDWCFDRTRPNSAGEYPVVLWDHELRAAEDRYPNFDSWFAGEFERYLFGDE